MGLAVVGVVVVVFVGAVVPMWAVFIVIGVLGVTVIRVIVVVWVGAAMVIPAARRCSDRVSWRRRPWRRKGLAFARVSGRRAHNVGVATFRVMAAGGGLAAKGCDAGARDDRREGLQGGGERWHPHRSGRTSTVGILPPSCAR